MTFRLPRLQQNFPLVDVATGYPTITFQRWWQSVAEKIEDAIDRAENALSETALATSIAQEAIDDAKEAIEALTAGFEGLDSPAEADPPASDHEPAWRHEMVEFDPAHDGAVATNYLDLASGAQFVQADRRLGWSADDGTAVLGLPGMPLPLGQKTVYYALNNSGEAISKGHSVMYNDGSAADAVTIAKAVTDGTFPAAYVLGIAAHDFADGEYGYVVAQGILAMDTTVWEQGDVLVVDPAVPGGLSSAGAVAPDMKSPIAIVLKDAAEGLVLVRVDRPQSLEDMQDVQVTLPANKHILYYDNANTRWANIPNGEFVFDRVTVYDADFWIGNTSTSDMVLNFAPTDYLRYDRTANEFSFFIGGESVVSIDSTGIVGGGDTSAVADGGTGATSFADDQLIKGNGTDPLASSIIYDNGSAIAVGSGSYTSIFNVNGDSFFSEAVYFGDTGFFIGQSLGNPIINWADDDYDLFNRGGNIRSFVIGGDTLMTVSGGIADGVEIQIGGALKRLTVGDADSGGAGFRTVRVSN